MWLCIHGLPICLLNAKKFMDINFDYNILIDKEVFHSIINLRHLWLLKWNKVLKEVHFAFFIFCLLNYGKPSHYLCVFLKGFLFAIYNFFSLHFRKWWGAFVLFLESNKDVGFLRENITSFVLSFKSNEVFIFILKVFVFKNYKECKKHCPHSSCKKFQPLVCKFKQNNVCLSFDLHSKGPSQLLLHM